jgi:hypothetical protein
MSALEFVRSAIARVSSTFRNDPRLAFELAAWRLALPVLTRVVSLPRLARWMWCRPLSLTDADRRQRLTAISRVAGGGGRVLLSVNCVQRSLVLYRLLSRAAAAPKLVLGVRGGGAGIAGHAWVELDGEPVGDDGAHTYQRLVTIGAGGHVAA